MLSLKPLIRRALASDAAIRLLRPGLLGSRATILVLHRFAHPDGDPDGADPGRLRACLALLRRNNYRVLPLATLIETALARAPLPAHAVAFTVDDGYADFAEVGAPVFAEFDCPVTVFLPSGFIDGTVWMWWDRLQHVFLATRRRALDITVDGIALRRSWQDRAGARLVADAFTEMLKRVPDGTKERIITALGEQLEVEIPRAAPQRYRAMTWGEVRACARRGVTYGPHTVTHPILSRVDDARAAHEIAHSWRRLREETEAAIPVFCYPNGDPDSFGPRECRIVAAAGLRAAVTTERRHVASEDMARAGFEGPFRVPRFDYAPKTPHGLALVVSGWERAREGIRGALPAFHPLRAAAAPVP